MNTYPIYRHEREGDLRREVTLKEIRYLLTSPNGISTLEGIVCLKEDDSRWLIDHKEVVKIRALAPDDTYQLFWEDDEAYNDEYPEARGVSFIDIFCEQLKEQEVDKRSGLQQLFEDYNKVASED